MYLVDYHVHTKRCGHAGGKDREYIETAIKRGLKEMGFSDHVPMFYEPDKPGPVSKRGMSWSDLEEYVATVTRFKTEFHKEIVIKLGLEVDFVPGWEREIERIAAMYPWDYLTGSVHFFPEWNYGYIAREEEHGPEEIYPLYFKRVAEAGESKLFDILAHIDLPKRSFTKLAPGRMEELHQETAERLGNTGAVIELNTYGIRGSKRGDVGIYPDRELLALCHDRGVRATLGSDAHRPKDVAADFDRAMGMLAEAGYEEIITYTARRPHPVRWRE
jgi:histidinol-phosphatase (PHP family)